MSVILKKKRRTDLISCIIVKYEKDSFYKFYNNITSNKSICSIYDYT